MTSAQFLKKYSYSDTPNTSRIPVLELEKQQQNFSVQEYTKALLDVGAEKLNALASQKAIAMFRQAALAVPAYQDFLKVHKINPAKVRTSADFQNVPPVTKENYLLHYPKESLFWNGKRDGTTMLSVSSGSTGKPYYWPRSAFLEYDTALTHELIAETFFHLRHTSTLVIDAYSMGMYVAGTFTLNSFRKLAKKGYPVTVVSPGIDVHEVLQIIKDIGADYDQIILAGYPPFVKDIIDRGVEEHIPWIRLNMKFIFGAENFSEDWRTNILHLVGIRGEKEMVMASMNTYGSADCAVLGHETPLSITIRRIIHRRRLSKEVFGSDFPPTLVQYNPLQRYFEKANGHLVFTANSGIPLIRYDIKDEGKLLSYEDLQTHIGSSVISSSFLNPWRSLPFLALAGRSGNTVTLYGLNIYPESIKMALEDKQIIRQVSGKFKLATKNDRKFNQYLEITLELASAAVSLPAKAKATIQRIIVTKLQQLNFEYSKLYEKLGQRAEPKIIFAPRGTFQQMSSKHRWTTR